VDLCGTELIGRTVKTREMGSYPGGLATVTEIAPDPNAPEIAFTVQHPTWRDKFCEDGEIGVFGYEIVDAV